MRIVKIITILSGLVTLGYLSSAFIFNLQRKHAQMERNAGGKLDKIIGDTYSINLDPSSCQVDIEEKLGTSSLYKEVLNKDEGLREISINSIADHNVGDFPNAGNPNRIKEHSMKMSIPLIPKIASQITWAQGFDSGVLFSGVSIDPFTAEFFIGSTGAINREWNITTLTSTENLGLDCNNAHVQPTGKYHYHGTPSAYLQDVNADGSKMQKVGYSADGFPIYYKYGYDNNGNIQSYESGYTLKKGDRPGDGVSAPNGNYNGRYFNDYEYVDVLSDLDECNGKWGKTPESDNEYYYVITDNFPSVPLCFSGTLGAGLRKGGGRMRGPKGRENGNGERGHRPPPRNKG